LETIFLSLVSRPTAPVDGPRNEVVRHLPAQLRRTSPRTSPTRCSRFLLLSGYFFYSDLVFFVLFGGYMLPTGLWRCVPRYAPVRCWCCHC
jgi:hypothetical protein